MNRQSNSITEEVRGLLRQWLGADLPIRDAIKAGHSHFTLSADFADLNLIIAITQSDSIGLLDITQQSLADYNQLLPNVVPIISVPYMGPKARAYLRDSGISWMDLSGNADIRGPGLRVLIEGQPNRFATPGRPSTLFSPKATRLSRALLVEPARWWLQNELAAATELSAGYISKIIRRMHDDALITRHPDGRLRPASPDLLLDTWAQAHDFRRNDIRRYHAIGRTGEAILRALTDKLTARADLRWAATGLAAAWQHARHADFRLTTLYVAAPILHPEDLGLRPVAQGENVWLVTPKDDGVFYRAEAIDGIPCVHPVQCYLDLLAHPERAPEAAADLRRSHLPWSHP
ncbi:MAG: hypothetical protein H6701_08540 [Myxococcales bacterium]|nr:hypothetical protein [Myxococcales bacterium]